MEWGGRREVRIDLPQCNLRFCRYCFDHNCTASEVHRQRCEYASLRAQQQENNPLTLEELHGMRGEPVYVVKGKCQWWDIVDFIAGGWLYLRIANKTDLAIDGYSNGWLAYRRKPEVQDG